MYELVVSPRRFSMAAPVGAQHRREAQAGVMAFLILLAGLCLVSPALLNDPDTQWHIAAGRWTWANGWVPQTDVFSHTFAGSPWIAKEWLSQLLFYAAFALGEWRGVALLAAIAIAVSFALLFTVLQRRIRRPVALAVVLLSLLLADPEFLARPHILVLPVVVLWMAGLVSALERRTAPAFWMPALMALWANMHASYPLGLLLAGLLAGEGLLAAALTQRRRDALRWAAFLAASVAATCVSPYGFRTLEVIIGLFAAPEAIGYIAEWQPLGVDPQGMLAAATFLVAVAALAPNWRANGFRILATLLLGYLMARHSRFTLLFAVLVPVLTAGPAARRFEALRPDGANAPMRFGTGIVVALLLLAAAIAAMMKPQPNPSVTPSAALRAAMTHGLRGPVYNDYDFGGYLILQGVPTFVDGRSDQLFSGGFLTRLNAAIDAPGDDAFGAFLKARQVSWSIVRTHSAEARHFSHMEGWSKIFQDDVAAVYAR